MLLSRVGCQFCWHRGSDLGDWSRQGQGKELERVKGQDRELIRLSLIGIRVQILSSRGKSEAQTHDSTAATAQHTTMAE